MLYTEEILKKANKKILISSIMIGCFLSILVVFNVLLFININKENRLTFQVLLSVFDVLIGFAVIYAVSNYLVKYIQFKVHFKFMNRSESVSKIGVLEQINPQSITLRRGICCKTLIFNIDGEKKEFYLNESFDTSSLVIGETYKFSIVSLFIKELYHEN